MTESNLDRIPGTLLGKNWVHALLIIAVICLIFSLEVREGIKVAGTPGFTMDDSWIHMSMARNLVEGHGFSINKGEPLAVSTSPTWTLIEALFFLITKNPIVAGLTTSLLCSILAAWLTYLATRRVTNSPAAGLVAASLLILNPISIWGLGSGMELPLVLMVIALVFCCYFSHDPDSIMRKYVTPVTLAFAAVSRPELFVLIPIAILDTSWQLYRHKEKNKKLIVNTFVIQCGVTLIALSPYFIFNYLTLQHLFPTTFYAKATLRGVGITGALSAGHYDIFFSGLVSQIRNQFITLFTLLSKLDLFFFLLFPVGLLMFTRILNNRSEKLGLFFPVSFLVLPAIMAIVAPPNALANTMNRYYTLFVPFFAISGAFGWHILYRKTNLKYLAMAILAVSLCYQAGNQIPKMIKKVAIDVHTNNKLYVDLGKWVAENLEPDAYLAVNDIGGVAYFAGHRRILDLMGLASPEIWPVLKQRKGLGDVKGMREYMQKQNIEYLIISPYYYPKLAKDTETFQEIARFSVNYRIGHQWSPQIIYKCNWH